MSIFSFRGLQIRIQENWKSGVTVSLVSIPLSVSLAVASQSTPIAGIITAIWAGFFASVFGGSNYNIVGPTGALSGLLAAYAISHGAASLSSLALVGGIFILVAYFFKLQKFLVFVPASTMHGFTLGVAFVIGMGQFGYATGISGLPVHERFIDTLMEYFKHLDRINWEAFSVFVVFLTLLFVAAKYFPKVPGAILLAPIGIVLGYFSSRGILPIHLMTLGQKYADMKGVLFQFPSFSFQPQLISAGLAVAVVAILETMISAKIADGITKTKHKEEKEVLGLGLANIASGLAGGLPATAALARTALNIKSGANHTVSASVSSISIALISLLFLGYFTYIPLAVIASILVSVAIRMVEGEHFVRMFRADKLSFVLSLVVAFVSVYEDPMMGILLGTAVTMLVFMQRLSHGQFAFVLPEGAAQPMREVSHEELPASEAHSDTLVYSIKGALAYVNSRAHISRLEKLPSYKNVILHLRPLSFLDLDGVDAMSEMIEILRTQGKRVLVSSANAFIKKSLQESDAFRKLEREKMVFENTADALAYLDRSTPDRE